MILEQNVLPGRANTLFGRFATYFCSSFPSTQQHLRTPCTYTGNPIRKIFPKTPLSEAITSEPWPQSPIIGIFGGSQGARYINQWIHTHQDELNVHQLSTFHITGTRDYEDAVSTHETLVQKDGYAIAYRPDGCVQTLLLPYLEDMELFYSIVSLVISRAGASTIAELIHFQTPAITIPYPYAKDKHQDYNARELEQMGLGSCIFEPKLTFKDLQHALSQSYSLTQQAPNARESICKLLTQF